MTRRLATSTMLVVLAAGLAAQPQPPAGRLDSKRYVDPKGNFSIIPPAGWRVQEYPSDPRGKVAFAATEAQTDLRVLTNAVDFSTLDELVSYCRGVEGRIGVPTNIRKSTFGGRPAVERNLEMKGLRFRMVDFLIGQTDHNIQFAGPPAVFEKYRSLVDLSMQTYEPNEKTVSPAEANAQLVAKMKRLAELMLQNGQTEQAAEYVRRGLEADPKNADLLRLRGQIKPPGAAK